MGVLLFRREQAGLSVLLGHMGGPFWQRKDAGAWSIPKGEPMPHEEPFETARREFEEELGVPLPHGPRLELGSVRQSGGKVVTAWAIEADLDPDAVVPGTFELEWPPRSGRMASYPEVDRVRWMPLAEASELIIAGQRPLLERLAHAVGDS